mmetsp:Transcript_22512/g.31358  ORF Transcript_22512/g.31358 Transcript_22512/m.31358 type:complete len:151 (+) Transcript_22512:41-493(+)
MNEEMQNLFPYLLGQNVEDIIISYLDPVTVLTTTRKINSAWRNRISRIITSIEFRTQLAHFLYANKEHFTATLELKEHSTIADNRTSFFTSLPSEIRTKQYGLKTVMYILGGNSRVKFEYVDEGRIGHHILEIVVHDSLHLRIEYAHWSC